MDKNYQEIFDLLSDYLPTKWKQLAVYFSISGTMSGAKFYLDSGKGYIDCFNLGYNQSDLMKTFI